MKIFLFGTGKGGKSGYEHLRARFLILGFCDNDEKKQEQLFCGLPVYSPAALAKLEYDQIVICTMWHEEVREQLISDFGIPVSKIGVLGCDVRESYEDKPLPSLESAPSRGLVCLKPFTNLEIHTGGDATFCCYIKEKVGNLSLKKTPDVFNSDLAQKIRQSFFDGSYSFCDKMRCEAFKLKEKNPENDLFKSPFILDDVRGDVESRRLVLDHGPSIIIESVHGLCNVKCIFCWGFERTQRENFRNLAYPIIRESQSSLRYVHFAGGEPFYNPMIKEILNDLLRGSISCAFTTNLNYLSKDVKKILPQLKISGFHVSLNAGKKTTYEFLMRGANWERIHRNLEWINLVRDLKPEMILSFSMVVNNQNFREIHEFLELTLGRYRADHVVLYPMALHPGNIKLMLNQGERDETKKILDECVLTKHSEERGRIFYFGLLNSLLRPIN